eukprot:CAMPEP_0196790092 /NCGR_PEP_ID=MMETSP1104-20130614/27684_1 /TAXON_ID=33652 /ORGANISM="Cafeteria sp., Strain Caron Lab Isolate" /LENGTH=45 /DNA_ID= /DNA_START= /DNA_END= /DNA_ORIENTATION=
MGTDASAVESCEAMATSAGTAAPASASGGGMEASGTVTVPRAETD